MHLDEATPHLHIDFVPFTTGSKRGLDTRVSLKQALANQGFVGNGREETEWALWVNSEKNHWLNLCLILILNGKISIQAESIYRFLIIKRKNGKRSYTA